MLNFLYSNSSLESYLQQLIFVRKLYTVADEYSADRLNSLTSEANDSKIGVQESSQDESGPDAMRSLLT